MTSDDRTPDRDLADALRQFDHTGRTPPERYDALAHRIVAAATPILDRRRQPLGAWWEYAAAWARMLIPIGFATAVAAAAFIVWGSSGWFAHGASDKPLTIADNDTAASQRLLYFLVAPVEEHVTPPTSGEKQ